MMRMKQTMLALATTGMLAGPALAAEGVGVEVPGVLAQQPVQAVEVAELPAALAVAAPAPFSDADLQALFVPGTEPLRIAVLSAQEMEETKGAWVNFAVGGAVGFGVHAFTHRGNMTWRSAAIATGTGALTGGVGGALIRASGGGIAGNVAWRPNMLATNFGVSRVNNPSRR